MNNPILTPTLRPLILGRFVLPLLCCALSVMPAAFAQYSCMITYTCENEGCERMIGGSVVQRGPVTVSSPAQCESQAARNPSMSASCSCRSTQPAAPAYNAAPSGPTPEELRKQEEESAAEAEAEKKAAFLRDRDSTLLRDADGGQMSDSIRDSGDTNSSGGGIRDAATTPALGQLRDLAGSGDKARTEAVAVKPNTDLARHYAACGFGDTQCGLGGHIPNTLGPRPTPRTVELLSHIPDERRDDPKVVSLLVKFQDADRDRLNKASYLNMVRKELAAGTGDAAALTQRSEQLKTGMQQDAGTEKQTKEQLHEDLSAVWIEEPQIAPKSP